MFDQRVTPDASACGRVCAGAGGQSQASEREEGSEERGDRGLWSGEVSRPPMSVQVRGVVRGGRSSLMSSSQPHGPPLFPSCLNVAISVVLFQVHIVFSILN